MAQYSTSTLSEHPHRLQSIYIISIIPLRISLHIFLLLFFSITIFSQTRTGIIKGRVIGNDNADNSMTGANVILLNSTLGAATDLNGNYEIKNVPLGKYIVKCCYIAYATQIDTIELTEDNSEITKNFNLRVLKIPISMPDSIKEYHKLFADCKPEDILNIFIDSLSGDYRIVYLTFTNKSKYSVYLIEDLPCFKTISIIVKNESGKIISRNWSGGCDVILITLPKKVNLIELKPLATIHFSIMQDYKNYPLLRGKYYMTLKYEIKDYKYLPGVYSNTEFDYYNAYNEEMEVLNQATRGIYNSMYELVIEK